MEINNYKDINSVDTKTLKFVTFIFALVSCILIVVAIVSAVIINQTTATYKPAKAEILYSDYHENTFIEYNANGKKTQSSISVTSTSMSPGDKIDILYDPNNTRKVVLDGLGKYLVSFICGGLSVFFAGFTALFIWAIRKRKPDDTDSVNQESIS